MDLRIEFEMFDQTFQAGPESTLSDGELTLSPVHVIQADITIYGSPTVEPDGSVKRVPIREFRAAHMIGPRKDAIPHLRLFAEAMDYLRDVALRHLEFARAEHDRPKGGGCSPFGEMTIPTVPYAQWKRREGK